MKISGAQAIVKSLEYLGVKDVFGIPGGATLPLYDALADSKIINHYLMRHEQCAAHAADGYARASGKIGVCMATSGPGATNLVTGIANAYMDSIPIVAFTGQVPTHVIGTDAFQEADITGITLPIVKHSYLVTDATDIPQIVAEAFYIASTGRPGPVLIDIPRDIQQQFIDYHLIEKVTLPGYKPTIKGHARQIKESAKLILESKRPVLLIGGGIITSGASEEVFKLATTHRLPVTWTLMGKGGFPENHELSMGMIGMHGTKTSNMAVQNCDLLIGAGVRFDDRATGNVARFAPHASIIHIDIDPAEVSKIVKASVPIVGDARTILKALNEYLSEFEPKANHEGWLSQIKKWKKNYALRVPRDKILKPQLLVHTLKKMTAGMEIIVTTGVGQNQMWAAQYFNMEKPRHFISSGGLGTMGFGLPSAIGAQVAKPDALVIDIDGDGSFQMVLQDLATIACYNLPVKIVIINNRYLGMVRQWQQLFYKGKYFAVDLEKGTPDFEELGRAYGIRAKSVKEYSQLEKSISEMLSHEGPFILDVHVEKEENVFPMVPAGAALDEIIGGEAK